MLALRFLSPNAIQRQTPLYTSLSNFVFLPLNPRLDSSLAEWACRHETGDDKMDARRVLSYSLHTALSPYSYLEPEPWPPSPNDRRGGMVFYPY